MWRRSSSAIYNIGQVPESYKIKININKVCNTAIRQGSRNYCSPPGSTSSSSSSTGKAIGTLVAAGVIGTGCSVYYASGSADKRQQLESYLPFSKGILNLFLGKQPALSSSTFQKQDDFTFPLKSLEAKDLDKPSIHTLEDAKASEVSISTVNTFESESVTSTRKNDDVKDATTSAEQIEKVAIHRQEHAVEQESKLNQQQIKSTENDDKNQGKSVVKEETKVMTNDSLNDTINAKTEPAVSVSSTNQELSGKIGVETDQETTDEQFNNLVDNSELVPLLEKTMEDFLQSGNEACNKLEQVSESYKEYTQSLQAAIQKTDIDSDEGKNLWDKTKLLASNATMAESDAANTARNFFLIDEKMQSLLDKGKESDEFSGVEVLQEDIVKLRQRVQEANVKLEASKIDASIINEYKEQLDKARLEFIEAIKDSALEKEELESTKDLSSLELNLLVAFTHRRIEQLTKELEQHRVLEQKRLKEALKKKEELTANIAESHYQIEKERLNYAHHVEMERKISMLQDDYEADLRRQLKRQSAAHSDHLQQKLQDQAENLEEKWAQETASRINDLEKKHHLELKAMLSRLHGIESAITERSTLLQKSKQAQDLWLACQSLDTALSTVVSDSITQPLKEHFLTLEKLLDDEPLANVALQIIPKVAIERGVYTEEGLMQRFVRVKKIAQRVNLIGDERGSLLTYALSYFQSFLMFNVKPNLDNKEINPKDLDTYKLLAYADHYLFHGDLEQAIRFVNQLRGEPRRVASDWLREARLLLETRQAVSIIKQLSAVYGMRSL